MDGIQDDLDIGFAVQPGLSFGYLLRDTSRLVLRAMQADLERHGITLGQFFVLRELWENEGLTPSQISARVGILDPSTNSALDAIERLGLIERQRNDRDRRKVHVSLTDAGRALREQLLGYAVAVNRRALDGVSREELAAARDILTRVKRNLSG